jgi:hypothetical protein
VSGPQLPKLPRDVVRGFACPKCGAAAGEACTGARKQPQERKSNHAARVWAAQRALDGAAGHY